MRAVTTHSAITVRGGGTKSGLLAAKSDSLQPETRQLDTGILLAGQFAGIVTYEASEFLITARAGTPITTLQAALAEHGQYLPFDPVFVAAGATLGGTIASGISGPDRMLYGSLRDFVMEVELIDGCGRLVRGGGKVVKNSAGFDLPKLMVGSYGRFGVLTEATLKVFPKPPAYVTQRFEFASLAAGLAAMQKLQTNPLPISAIEIEPQTQGSLLVVRFAGRHEALETVARRAEQLLGQSALQVAAPEKDTPENEASYWRGLSEFEFVPEGCGLVRIAMSGRKLLAIEAALGSLSCVAARRYSAGASVGWIAVAADSEGLAELDRRLRELEVAGVVVRGASEGLTLLGDRGWVDFSERIRVAMDPERKFGGFA